MTMVDRRTGPAGFWCVRDVFALGLLMLGAGLFACGTAGASDWSALENRSLTLGECIAIAEENSPILKKSQTGVWDADAGVMQAWSGVLPTASNYSGYYRFDDERYYVTGAGGLEHSKVRYSTTLSVEQTIFRGFGNVAAIGSARAGRQSAESNYRNTLQDLRLLVKTRYIEVLKAQALLRVRQEAVDLSQQHLESAEAFYRAGEKTRADVLRARVELAQNQLDLISARNDVKTAQASLSHAMGIPVGIQLDIVDLSEEPVGYEGDVDHYLAEAEETHPLLAARRATVDGARWGIKEAKSKRWPSLTASWDYQWNDIRITHLDEPGHRWSDRAEWWIRLSMSVNLFDGRLTKSNIKRAETGLAYAGQDYEASLADVLLGVKQAHLDILEAQERIRCAQEAVDLAEEDRRLQEERYRLGEGTLLELNDALVALTDARVSKIGAVYDYHLAEASLERAIGRD